MECREITEGSTTFTAPVQDETAQFPPGSAPVFYNTKMAFNRDMTVLLTKVIQPADYLDAMAATGVRGLVVISCLRLPSTLWLLACAISIPLFGAVSSYGACSVLGVPFAYIYASLLGGNSVVVLAAISLIAAVGDMMPPTA